MSLASNDAVATVSKDAAVVGILNKVSESKLLQDLKEVAEKQGGEAHAIISAAEAPVKLDASALGIAPVASPKASGDLFGAIEGIQGGFGGFGELGFEKFGVVSLKPESDNLFGADKFDAPADVSSVANVASPFMAAAPAAPSKFGLDHDDSRFTSKFDLSLGG